MIEPTGSSGQPDQPLQTTTGQAADADDQATAEREVVNLMGRLIRAAADIRGHSPSRANAHGRCEHCAATRQATAFVRAMASDNEAPVEESRIIRT